ncbi:4-(cytidine 5'-diphospho)-2-C-methyl-D-erythritol kinase [Sporomusa termitida]|uniref:4-diphosphocytidyl-2-C-methyl-D-erythritol kinase n=1 Tax=Sporomusa termitida TaxID=2377 RepID=A0A517E105_9FIRM|nr:4-(cytidine 5'-diphospho)-2-C-methyl-D-erythritol kinase [Sporomusa termitida]QDR83285.1 4-diphosphocytidyl-2-C-methyl-D-erythritol kinase [Sporomusa termitida]
MLTLKAYAKINLALDVFSKRPDGYHEVAMIMQSVSLADTIVLTEQPASIDLSVTIPGLPADGSNLAYRAAALLAEYAKPGKGVHIHLDKQIPLAAGLAGGSADAAAVLRGLNQLWELNLSVDELSKLAAQLGSDVPFCLYNGTMLATGRGEIVRPLPPLPDCYVILAKPAVAVSTAWVYGRFTANEIRVRPDINAMCENLAQGNLAGVAGRLTNVLESVTISEYPQIAAIKNAMLTYGAMAALMSGSGPTVFGLAGCQRQAEKIAGQLKAQGVPEVFVAKTVSKVE